MRFFLQIFIHTYIIHNFYSILIHCTSSLLFSSHLISSHLSVVIIFMAQVGQPLPKFGEWDVNDPASAEGFTVIFNKARNEKKTGGTTDSPPKTDSTQGKPGAANIGKPQSKKWFCFKA